VGIRVVLLLAAAARLPAADDPRDIVRRATEVHRRDEEIARNYTYIQRSEKRTLNSDGSVKRTEIRTYDVTFPDGTPYARPIAADDKPLPPDWDNREREKLRQNIEARRSESPRERARRIAEWEKKRARSRAFVNELLDAMDFRLAGEEPVAGRAAWVIEATPHPGYRPKSTEAKFLTETRGKMWIDKEDCRAARVEAEIMADVPFGAFLAKVNKGTRFVIEQVKVNNEVWLPKRIEGRISARILVTRVGQTFDYTYRDYRKFQAESRIVSTGADREP
jgi:hypothetical protein